ncbi:hypothetical protein NST12_16355 [Bacillus sp. FSL W8-1127]|uniref:hypothetical protein n=1 Tax=Bacillus sp. FSL W8-1127 TaxID=2954710 RepID=UPI0030F8705F
MSLLNELVIGKVINMSGLLLIKEENQVDKLVKVFEFLIGKQEYFFQQQQRAVVKEIAAKHIKDGLTLTTLLQEIVNSNNEYLLAFKNISKEILSKKNEINKLAFLVL